MFSFRYEDQCEPRYMTEHSAAADLVARKSVNIPAGGRAIVPTGVWIAKVNWEKVPDNFIPELQVRSRSSLAYKKGIMLANGLGTIDADYPDEIGVILYNSTSSDFEIATGERIAQMTLNLVGRLSEISVVESKRSGGFGSTGK